MDTLPSALVCKFGQSVHNPGIYPGDTRKLNVHSIIMSQLMLTMPLSLKFSRDWEHFGVWFRLMGK